MLHKKNMLTLTPNTCITAHKQKYAFGKGFNEVMQDMLALVTDGNCKVEAYVSDVHRYNLQVLSHLQRYKLSGIIDEDSIHYVDIKTIQDLYFSSDESSARAEVSHIERDIIKLINVAATKKVSDIHINIGLNNTIIQFRKYKTLQHYKEELRNIGYELIQTMYNTMTDVADPMFKTTEPQDAVINNPAYIPRNLNGVRVSITPTTVGWKAVLRLLYQSTRGTINSLEQLGYNNEQLEIIRKIKARSTGIMIVSGPTGSGKSTTLKVLLEEIARENNCKDDGTGCEINIMTVEDPSEYKILGAYQLAVAGAETDEERLLQYHKFLKALLRQDPDVIMIGEIRDVISGKAAIKSAMSGHLCLTTVHANDAIAVLDRLIEIGVERDNVLNSGIVTGLVAQRLVPRLCDHCSKPLNENIENYSIARVERLQNVFDDDLSGIKIRNIDGCEHCEYLGITGVTVLAEVIKTDKKFMRLYRENKVDDAYDYWRQEMNGKTLMQHGLEKIKLGLCDPADVEAELDEIFKE